MNYVRAGPAILCIVWALIALGATPARAYLRPIPEDNVEWTVADSDVIVRGVVGQAGMVTADGVGIMRFTVRVTETIKPGSGTGRPVDVGTTLVVAAPSQPAIAVGSEYVCFLVRTDRYLTRMGTLPAGLTAAYKACEYVLRHDPNRNPLPLNHNGSSLAMLDLDGERIPVAVILPRLRAESARPTDANAGSMELYISPTSEAFPATKRTYPQFLNILVDKRTEAKARQWIKSADPADRRNGAVVLAKLKSEENAAALRGLLTDPFVHADWYWPDGMDIRFPGADGKWKVTHYPIRRIAYEGLANWGERHKDAVITVPEHPPVYMARWAPAAMGGGLVALLLIVLARGLTYRRRARRAKRSSTPGAEAESDAPDGVGAPILSGVPGACLILFLIAATLWILSLFRATELSWPIGSGVRYELCAVAGDLRLARQRNWQPPGPAMFTGVARDSAGKVDADWEFPDKSAFGDPNDPPVDQRRMGFRYRRGQLFVDGFGLAYYVAWTVPLWAVCAVTAVPPGVRISRRVRRRTRAKAGCCPACGYDLRASAGRCPECGAVTST
ncbi:MAG TPA: zinc ribbon domain-containing protein [Tepidisphaeraceae bacterium]|nr:zinc ribbon domain-containing protein [Tepidisphaeraceae bacterium]